VGLETSRLSNEREVLNFFPDSRPHLFANKKLFVFAKEFAKRPLPRLDGIPPAGRGGRCPCFPGRASRRSLLLSWPVTSTAGLHDAVVFSPTVNARSPTYRGNRIDRESEENSAYDAVKPGKEGQHLLFPRLQLTRVVGLGRLDRRTVKPAEEWH
jgi:hypothetical protein